MPVDDTARIYASVTPQDQTIETDMGDFLSGQHTTRGLYFEEYSVTLPGFYQAVLAKHSVGTPIMGLFDHTEGSTPTERKLLLPFLQQMDPNEIGVGTSSLAHQLLHEKKILANVPQTAQQNDEALAADPRQFPTWRDALAAGYPLTWVGSWNVSPAASKQANTALIIVSAKLTLFFAQIIQDNFAWVKAHEPTIPAIRAALTESVDLATLRPPTEGETDGTAP